MAFISLIIITDARHPKLRYVLCIALAFLGVGVSSVRTIPLWENKKPPFCAV